MNETIITWNVANWVTVVLMAALGFFSLTLIAKGIQQYQGGGSSNNGNN